MLFFLICVRKSVTFLKIKSKEDDFTVEQMEMVEHIWIRSFFELLSMLILESLP